MTTTTATQAETATRALKDRASMGVVLAIASTAWFGWGSQGQQALAWLRVGMIVAAVVLVAAALVVHRIPGPPTLATDPQARKVYWLSVAAEVVLIVAGALVLGATSNAAYVSTWTLLVVGVHFLPFVRPFSAPILRATAACCVVVAALALWAGLAGWAPAPTVAGAGGGITLLGFAVTLVVSVAQARGVGAAGR
ncbi:hypothetical protein [Salana multivorans]